MNNRDEPGRQSSVGTRTRGTRAHSVARSGCAIACQRAANWALSPPGADAQPGQAGGYRARSADGFDAILGAGNPAIRIEFDATALERAPDPRAYGPH